MVQTERQVQQVLLALRVPHQLEQG